MQQNVAHTQSHSHGDVIHNLWYAISWHCKADNDFPRFSRRISNNFGILKNQPVIESPSEKTFQPSALRKNTRVYVDYIPCAVPACPNNFSLAPTNVDFSLLFFAFLGLISLPQQALHFLFSFTLKLKFVLIYSCDLKH